MYASDQAHSSIPKAALLAVNVATNTPAFAAGLRPGDLIMELDHRPVRHLREFHRAVGAAKPGSGLLLSVWRDGQAREWTVPAGRETFRRSGTFAVGLPGFVEGWQLWPAGEQPGLSLLVAGARWSCPDRVELGSAAETYARKAEPSHEARNQRWRFWLVVFNAEKAEQILRQEKAP